MRGRVLAPGKYSSCFTLSILRVKYMTVTLGNYLPAGAAYMCPALLLEFLVLLLSTPQASFKVVGTREVRLALSNTRSSYGRSHMPILIIITVVLLVTSTSPICSMDEQRFTPPNIEARPSASGARPAGATLEVEFYLAR